MRKILFLILTIAVFVLPAVMASASGEAESKEKVTLRLAWWGNPTRDERTLKVVELYQKAYPNVTIEPETVGWAGYWDRINTQVASNSMPDVMQQDYAYLLQFVDRKLMADLTPYVSGKVINLDGVDDAYLSGGRVGGKLYGVSLGTNAVCLIYDPDILKKAGVAEPTPAWTMADFEKMSLQIFQKTGVQTLPFFTTDPRVGFDNWIRQTGKPFFAGKALGFSDTAQLEEFWNVQLRLLSAGVLLNPESAFVTVSVAEDPFTKGTSWCQFVWSNQVVASQAAAKKAVKIALLPRITSGYSRPGTYLKPSMFFSVPAQSKIGAQAAKFINFFLTNLDANKVLLGERGVPIFPTVRDTVKETLDPYASMVFDYIGLVGKGNASAIDPPDPAAAGEILKLFRDTTMQVLYKKSTPKDAAAAFISQANQVLGK